VRRADKETAAAAALADSGEFAESYQRVSRALALDPENLDALLLRARIVLSVSAVTRDPADAAQLARAARDDLTTIAQLAPDSRQAELALGMLGKMRGGDLFVEPSATCSDDAARTLDEAEVLFGKKDFVGAEAAYARATAACPENAKWWTWYGDVYFLQEQYARAGDLYRKAIAIAPCYWSAHRFLADAQRRGGDEAGAYHSLARAVVCNPGYDDAWNDLVLFAASHGASFTRPSFDLPPVDPEIGGQEIGGPVTSPAVAPPSAAAEAAPAPMPGVALAMPRPAAADADPELALEAQAGLVYQLTGLASRGATPLERRRAAVHAGLQYIGPERLAATYTRSTLRGWQLLARADAAGFLDEAILVLLVDAELVPELLALQASHPERLVTFLERFVAPVAAYTPTDAG
jgi:tetratricopeptide (TPR) repeat protein